MSKKNIYGFFKVELTDDDLFDLLAQENSIKNESTLKAASIVDWTSSAVFRISFCARVIVDLAIGKSVLA